MFAFYAIRLAYIIIIYELMNVELRKEINCVSAFAVETSLCID